MLTFDCRDWNERIQPNMLKAGYGDIPGRKHFKVIGEDWSNRIIQIEFVSEEYESFFTLLFV